MKYIAILLVFLIMPNCFSQKIKFGIAYEHALEEGDKYYFRGEKDIGRHYFLAGSKSMLEYIDRKYQAGEPTLALFQEWLEWQKKLVDIFNQWYNSIAGRYVFIYTLIAPYQNYYLTAKPFDCEGESGQICMEYEGIKELAMKYGNEELVDYFDIKINEPRKGDGYDCEGQSTNYEKPLMVLEKCEKFIEEYQESKYKDEIQNILEIAQRDYQRLKNRYENKKKH